MQKKIMIMICLAVLGVVVATTIGGYFGLWTPKPEKSKDISSIVYLIPNRRQCQHSLISLRYVKLIAIRTRGDRHCQRCHHRRASIVTLIIARAFSLSRTLPNSTQRKPKRGRIIAIIVPIVVVVVIIIATFASSSSRKFPPIMR